MLVTDSQPRPEDAGAGEDAGDHGNADGTVAGRLRLRGAARTRPRVAWVEDTVDNEGMGKKKTKSALHIRSRSCNVEVPETDASCPYSLLHLPQTQEIRRIIR